MDSTRYLIVGAGVTGLSFAAFLEDDDYLICEGDGEIGGYCKTVHQDGFVWDYSGHFFHFRHPDVEQYLRDRMGDQRIFQIEKDARIYYAGRHIDFPFQKNIHQLPFDEFIDCLVDLFDRPSEQANFRDMLYAKFGRGISEKFLIPYNEKLYATDVAKLDVDAMGRFFPHVDVPEIIRGFRWTNNASYNATFTYPEGGAIQYIHALMKEVDESKLSLRERVESIDLEKRIATTNRRQIRFDHMVSSAPFPSLLRMTQTAYDPEVYAWNKVLVFNLGFDRKGPQSVHWMYFPQRELRFYRVGFYDNIHGTDRMSLYVEIGCPADAAIDDDVIARERERVLQDLAKCGIVTDQELVSSHSVVLDPAYVHVTREAIEDVEVKRRELAEQGVHSLGRYGAWKYCSIEDNILEARELARAFNG